MLEIAFSFPFGEIIMRIQTKFMDFSDINRCPWWSPRLSFIFARFKRAKTERLDCAMNVNENLSPDFNFTAHHRRYFPNIRADVGDRQHSRRKNDDRSSFKSKPKWFFWHSQSSVITRMKRELGLFTRVVRFSQLRSFSISADSIAWNECEDGDELSTQGEVENFVKKYQSGLRKLCIWILGIRTQINTKSF